MIEKSVETREVTYTCRYTSGHLGLLFCNIIIVYKITYDQYMNYNNYVLFH